MAVDTTPVMEAATAADTAGATVADSMVAHADIKAATMADMAGATVEDTATATGEVMVVGLVDTVETTASATVVMATTAIDGSCTVESNTETEFRNNIPFRDQSNKSNDPAPHKKEARPPLGLLLFFFCSRQAKRIHPDNTTYFVVTGGL